MDYDAESFSPFVSSALLSRALIFVLLSEWDKTETEEDSKQYVETMSKQLAMMKAENKDLNSIVFGKTDLPMDADLVEFQQSSLFDLANSPTFHTNESPAMIDILNL